MADDKNIFDLYLKDISKYTPLSLEEEVALSLRIKKGDKKALHKLVLSNLRYLVSVANKYRGQGVPIEDLISIGHSAMIRAALKYDGSKKYKFISYAIHWIRSFLLFEISHNKSMIHLPDNRMLDLKRILKSISLMLDKNVENPSILDIAKHTKISKENIKILMPFIHRTLSLNAPVKEDTNSSLLDFLEDSAPNQEVSTEITRLKKKILESLEKLSDKERYILLHSFGLENRDKKKLKEIGSRYNISKERTRQIRKKALVNLKVLDAQDGDKLYAYWKEHDAC